MGDEGKIENFDINSLQPGPIRHESLSDEQMGRLRRVHEALDGIDGQTLQERVDSFKRDVHPDQELDIWESIAGAYGQFCATRDLEGKAKREVFSLLLMRSMCSEEESLERVELTALSNDEAQSLLRDL